MQYNMLSLALDSIFFNPYRYIPERGLLAAVLRRAVLDLWYSGTRGEAISWFTDRKSYFRLNKPWKAIGYQDCIDWLELSAGQVKAIEKLVSDTTTKVMPEGGYNGKCYTEGEKGREGSCEAPESAITWMQRQANAAILRDGRY